MDLSFFAQRLSPSLRTFTRILRATSHLCGKREWPLIITYSIYSENTMHYHFYLKHVTGG